jgi:chemotaxis-related protein WspB
MILGRPAPGRLSTRILIIRIKRDHDFRLVGVIAEKLTETMRCDPSDFVSPGIISSETPFLSSVHVDKRGPVQRIDVDRLLAGPHGYLLFETPAAA